MVELNRAVAVSHGRRPRRRASYSSTHLAARGALPGYHLLPATRADLLRRLGRLAEAADAYRAALELAGTDAERRYLESRLTHLWDG